MAEHWLLADVGGTRTRVALAGPSGLLAGSLQNVPNAGFDGLVPLLKACLEAGPPVKISALCAGVAGPVRGHGAQLTNHDWYIGSAALQQATGAVHVTLLNDLQAQGYALNDLRPDQVHSLFPGTATGAGATRLVLGLGTGCNVAVVHGTASGDLMVPPAEFGHTSLPCSAGKLADLAVYLGRDHAHRPVESALSGPGLGNIHAFLTGTRLHPDEVIAAHNAGNGAAKEALTLFSQLLGQVMGDLALAHLPMGGIYLIGGVARAVAPFLEDMGFYERFIAKGPYAEVLREIPISLITDDGTALLGCARYLRQVSGSAPQA